MYHKTWSTIPALGVVTTHHSSNLTEIDMYTSQTHGNTGIPLSLFGTVQNGMAHERVTRATAKSVV